mmetsp:Transcript_45929/g.95546  ORF Transcript_45929/g.95546 Transcript_45929/m.95546 type:complete len:160 (+) Transcript_45929:194-673(+)
MASFQYPADVAQMPAAGCFRGRALGPREHLGRAGSHALAPALHPKAEHLLPTYTADADPGRHTMRLSRTPSQGHIDVSLDHTVYHAGQRPAGVGGFFQTAKTRGEFKQHAVVGQYSNKLTPSIPAAEKHYHSIRQEGSVYNHHQKATSAFRGELERGGP